MDKDTPAPGESPLDPHIKDIDAVAFAVSRTLCHLIWIDEHAHSFTKLRTADPALAEQELKYLLHSIPEALKHMRRLRDLLIGGYTIDPNKKLPKGIADQ